MALATELEFTGTDTQQTLARRVFSVIIGQGSLYGRDALIRQSLDNLAAFLAEQDGGDADKLRPAIDAAVQANPAIFAREERDGTVLIGTSRRGVGAGREPDRRHTFAQRLYEPIRPLPVEDINNIVTTVRPPLTTVEPVQISGYWRMMVSGQSATEPVVAAPSDEGDVAPVVADELEAVVAEPVEQVEAAPTPVAQPETTSTTTVVLSDGTHVDLTGSVADLMAQFGQSLQAEVAAAIAEDPLRRVVSFGDVYYSSDSLPNFGKNDLRRMRDYIVEQAEPMSDVAILSDVYRERPGSSTFETFRFGLNYRLSREKDFDFVGTYGNNLWSAKGLAAVGSKRVKAGDLGQFYAYEVDGYDDAQPANEGVINHYLTFFEWEYGVLPLNAAFASIMPQPLLDDQRAVALRIEASQHYTTYVAEARFPTPNRGGWIWGLEDFFREYVVPGTLITLSATDDPNSFTIAYEEIGGVEDKLLVFEEKRNRFAFMPITYYSAVDEDLLPNQKRYGKLRNLKALSMNDRKKADTVLEHVFETVGEQLGSKDEPLYWIQLSELLLAMNVLRPTSQAFLEHLLAEDDAYYADEATVGAYYYKPAPAESVADTADDDEDDEDDE